MNSVKILELRRRMTRRLVAGDTLVNRLRASEGHKHEVRRLTSLYEIEGLSEDMACRKAVNRYNDLVLGSMEFNKDTSQQLNALDSYIRSDRLGFQTDLQNRKDDAKASLFSLDGEHKSMLRYYVSQGLGMQAATRKADAFYRTSVDVRKQNIRSLDAYIVDLKSL